MVPDGKALALLEHDARENGLVEVVDVDTLHRRTIANSIGTLGRVDWSTKGQIVVPTTRPHPLSRLVLLDAASGEVRRVPGPSGRSAAFSPDGRRLAYSAQDGIVVVDLATHALRQVTDGGWQDDEPSWSPDGTRLVYTHAFGHCFTPAPGPRCNFDLFVVAVGGSRPVDITRTPKLLERTPTWLE